LNPPGEGFPVDVVLGRPTRCHLDEAVFELTAVGTTFGLSEGFELVDWVVDALRDLGRIELLRRRRMLQLVEVVTHDLLVRVDDLDRAGLAALGS
jgi:hypothetical protein